MKTIYTTEGRIAIDDNVLGLIDEAEQIISTTHAGNGRFIPEIQVRDLEFGVVKVGFADYGRNLEKISAEFGKFSYDGFESLIDFKDIRDLPDVYFQEEFVDAFTHVGSTSDGVEDLLDYIEPEHWSSLVPRLKEQAERVQSHPNYVIQHYWHNKRLIKACNNFEGNSQELVDAIKFRPQVPLC